MFPERFKEAVRKKHYYFFGNVIDTDGFDWYAFMRLLYTHPQQAIAFADDARRIELRRLQDRGRAPDFAKKLNKDLKELFKQNLVSNIAFCGPDLHHRSFKIHRDTMDVIYLQVLGSIEWSIWNSDCGLDSFSFPDQPATLISKLKMVPGDMIYVPRGMYHHVDPLSSRVGFSFGVEGRPDPSTYI